MDKGKYYVSVISGKIWLVLDASQRSTKYADFIQYTLWNCSSKTKTYWAPVPTLDTEEYYIEVTKEQAFNPDFQKWMKLCYGKQ